MSQRKIALKIFAPSTVICSVFGLVISLISGLSSSPASADVDLAEYRQFLADNTHQTAADMQAHYGSDVFREAANIDLSKAAFADSVIRHYGLTTYEQQLLGRHGFVVTERVHPRSFGQGFLDVYNADLPVFISTDAVLHALHMSYDAILRDLESQILMPRLQRALQAMHATLPAMAEGYADQPAMTPMLGDVDVYLTVARRLAGGARGEPVASGVFAQTDDVVGDLLTAMNRRSLESVELFGALRAMDFSQFKPRGHYAQDPELTRYFGAMMWLGRVEFYLDAPSGANLPEEVLARQTLDAVLLDDLILQSGAAADLEEIDRLLTGFVGTPDNLTLAELRQVRADTGLQDPVELLNAGIVADFRARAAVTGSQQILSQVILRDPLAADGLANALAAPAFLLLGQRFLIDSYIFANVVYDKIRHDGQPVFRGLPGASDRLQSSSWEHHRHLLQLP